MLVLQAGLIAHSVLFDYLGNVVKFNTYTIEEDIDKQRKSLGLHVNA